MNFSLSWVKSSLIVSVCVLRSGSFKEGKLLTLFLGVPSDQLNELRPDAECALVEFGDFLFFALASSTAAFTTHTQQGQKLLHILDLAKHVGLHLRIALQLILGRVLKLLDVVERKYARLAAQTALPPILVDRLEDSDDVVFAKGELAGLGGGKVEQCAHSAHRGSGGALLGVWLLTLRACLLLTGGGSIGSTGGGGGGGGGGSGRIGAALVLDAQGEGHLQLLLLLATVKAGDVALDGLAGRGQQSGVLQLELVVGLLHDAQVVVVGSGAEVVGPGGHAVDDLLLDLGMGGAVGGEAQQGIGEGLGGEFAVERRSAILRQRVRQLERVQLHVGVAVRQSLDQRCRRLRRA